MVRVYLRQEAKDTAHGERRVSLGWGRWNTGLTKVLAPKDPKSAVRPLLFYRWGDVAPDSFLPKVTKQSRGSAWPRSSSLKSIPIISTRGNSELVKDEGRAGSRSSGHDKDRFLESQCLIPKTYSIPQEEQSHGLRAEKGRAHETQ